MTDQLTCKCPSPLHWEVKKYGDNPRCKSCNLEVTRERAEFEMEQKYQSLLALDNYYNFENKKRSILIYSACGFIFCLTILRMFGVF